ncbi:MAG: gliding motility protein GldL [Prevotellaceae bacterium]|jgi:gliding motility-associated protein GldL|nr:gliding motility protein GldL [Prevotellaceae bacterium]
MSTKQLKSPSAFNVWYNGPVGQRIVGAIYSLGAAVVIIGALFKIMHWNFAGVILSAGMITEAILFSIGVFEKPHKSYHWENLFPALLADSENPAEINAKVPDFSSSVLKGDDAKKLESSIKYLSETAGNLSSLTNAATTSEQFTKNLSTASEAAATFASKQQNLGAVSNDLIRAYQTISSNLNAVSSDTKKYAERSEAVNNSLNAINTVYELYVKNVQAQAQSVQAQAQVIHTQTDKVSSAATDLETLLTALSQSAKDMDAYRKQTEKLTKQVSDLNTIYGNMLNATRS